MNNKVEFEVGSLLRVKTQEELLAEIFTEHMAMPEHLRDLQTLHLFLEEEEARFKSQKGIVFASAQGALPDEYAGDSSSESYKTIPFGYEGLLLVENGYFYRKRISFCKIVYGKYTGWVPKNNLSLM